MKNIQKPITLAREDFVKSLIELCNNSGLPFFCIEDILKNLIQEIHIAAVKQSEADKAEYEKKIKEQSSEK